MSNGLPQFDLFDFFSYIVPGFVAQVLFYPFYPDQILGVFDDLDSAVTFTFVVLLGFLLGHILYRAADRFVRYRFDGFSHKHVELQRRRSRSHIQNKFFKYGPAFFGITDTGKELYFAAKAHLYSEKAGSGRVEKFHTLSDLFHGTTVVLWIAGAVYVVFGLVAYLLDVLGGGGLASVTHLLFVLAGIVFLALGRVSLSLTKHYHTSHVLTLITEFYTNFLNDEEEPSADGSATDS